MAFKLKVTPEEFDAAYIGGEWWQRVPDEDDSSVFIVTAIHNKKKIDGEHYIITGAFYEGPRFIFGSSGIRDESPQEMAIESGAKQALSTGHD